jgi:hypothetical protein
MEGAAILFPTDSANGLQTESHAETSRYGSFASVLACLLVGERRLSIYEYTVSNLPRLR